MDGFDVVAVRIEHERAVVGSVVLRTWAWGAVVLSARGERRSVELVDRPAVDGCESKVHAAGWRSSPSGDPELRLSVRPAEGVPLAAVHHDRDAERSEGPLVELSRALEIVDV